MRWHSEPHCDSVRVARKIDGGRIGRWNCHACHRSYNVLANTVFCGTKIPLQKWFLCIGLMVNAKKSLSSHQLARDLNLVQSTALYMQVRIRAQMGSAQAGLLRGIVEVDETYVGGRPRHASPTSPRNNPRGRGTRKTPVIGAVERGGKVVAQVAKDLTGRGVLRFIKAAVDPYGSLLVTDEYRAYNTVRRDFRHAIVDHSKTYSDGLVHTNTIEGVWSLLKRA